MADQSDQSLLYRIQHAGFFAGFAPWIIFAVVASPSTWEWATLAALLAAVILALPTQGHPPKLLDLATVAFFAVLAVSALFLDRAELEDLERYAQAISSFALAALVLGSLPFLPFTEQYARENVPRRVWDSPLFKHTNRVLTALWGVVFLACGVMGVIAEGTSTGTENAVLNWVVPVCLIVGALKFTRYYAELAHERGLAAARAAGAAP
jgi:hypothetical protein